MNDILWLYITLVSPIMHSGKQKGPAEMKAPFQARWLKGSKQEGILHVHKAFLSKFYMQPKTTIIII